MLIYTTASGVNIHVHIVEDCGLVNGRDGTKWHKVLCRPIGFNNCPLMILDRNKLKDIK